MMKKGGDTQAPNFANPDPLGRDFQDAQDRAGSENRDSMVNTDMGVQIQMLS